MNAARALVVLALTLTPASALTAPAMPPDPAAVCRGADTLSWGWCLHQIGRSLEISAQNASAERCWRELATLPSIWQWEALDALSRLALARGDSSSAESLLAAAEVRSWPPADRAARLGRLAALRAARGDTAEALASCRQAMRAFPSVVATLSALALFDRLVAARGDSFPAEAAVAAAEVEFWNGARPAALARLERVLRARPPVELGVRWRALLRLAEMQRLARRRPAALATLETLAQLARDDGARARVWLERARVLRDGGQAVSAHEAYARAAKLSPERLLIETAWWESGRESEEQGEWRRAQSAYEHVTSIELGRAREARFRIALIELMRGRPGAARERLARLEGDAARFWWALAARDSDRAAADTVLARLARQPGYTFYRAAARESLGVSLLDIAAPPGPSPAAPDAALEFIDSLSRLGAREDARALLDRWSLGDARAGAPRDSLWRHPWLLLRGAAVETRAGRPREAIHLAERAAVAFGDSAAWMSWRAIAEIFPPHFAAPIDSALADPRIHVEGALMHAVIWQESHFDSGAISRSGAIGLSQLMPATAAEMARRLGDPIPADSTLAGAALNVRYGARHLATLLDQFGGRVPRALAAYNAGTAAVHRWVDRLPGASDALFCELIPYTETRDYVKRILGARQAYHDAVRQTLIMSHP